jgi:hypothetical protein
MLQIQEAVGKFSLKVIQNKQSHYEGQIFPFLE